MPTTSADVETKVEGRLGVITLNRARAINALSGDMIAAIRAQLAEWRTAEAVRAVLFEGRGEKGFCAGGDVRAVREAVVAGDFAAADAYFAHEYAMNGEIAGYEKPVIALCDGIVMGGGIGIAGHADFRFAAMSARFAMPETGIGFVADVGVNAILARAPRHRALLFLLSGATVGAGDARALGLTDAIVPADRLLAIRQSLGSAAEAAEVETAIVGLMQAETTEPEEPKLCADADRLAEALALDEAEDIVAVIEEIEGETPVYGPLLRTRSPTSLTANVISHDAARLARDLEAVLAIDLAFARHMVRQPDFAEGVRAVLVGKDNRPEWSPAGFEDLEIADLFALTGR